MGSSFPKWKVPLKLCSLLHTETILLGEEPHVTSSSDQFLVVNASQTSFCRVQYDWNLLVKLRNNLHSLGKVTNCYSEVILMVLKQGI